MPKNLKTCLEEISKMTWDLLRDANSLHASINEETITDLLAIGVKRKQSSIIVLQTTKAKEARTGMDIQIEGWFGSYTKWRRLAIQAKKLDVQSGTYLQMTRRNKHIMQLNALEEYADDRKTQAVYLLYNYAENVDKQHWNCPRRYTKTRLGCTITPSQVIRDAMTGNPGFADIHKRPETIPLRCLATCTHSWIPRVPYHQSTPLEFLGRSRANELKGVDGRNVLHVSREELRDSGLYGPNSGLPGQIWIFDTSSEEASR